MVTRKPSVVDADSEELEAVQLPSGGTFFVYPREVQYFNDRRRRYLKDNHFTNISDLQDVDRMLMLELLCWRWSVWISQSKDYWASAIDDKDYARMLKEGSAELRQVKSQLGIDKVSRDKTKGEDSVASYLLRLRERAREFGYMREQQLQKALELFNDLQKNVTLHDNCTDDERLELKCRMEDIFQWLREKAIPEYRAVDDHFKHNVQRMWVKNQ